MKRVDKAFAYITHGARLLVFEHTEFPEAGIQVPAGSIRAGESPAAAAHREAREETGLVVLSVPQFLGTLNFDARPFGKNELHTRHFFHLRAIGEVPERWRHFEQDPSDGSGARIEFDLYWLALQEAAGSLIAEHGALLTAVVADLD